MLDTNILIYLVKHRPRGLVDRISAAVDDEIVMSWVTYAELLKGAEGSQRREQTLDVISGLVDMIPVDYTVGSEMCRHFGRVADRLKRAGTPIGANDLWIACHALTLGAVVVTNNESEFSRIEGLDVRNWI